MLELTPHERLVLDPVRLERVGPRVSFIRSSYSPHERSNQIVSLLPDVLDRIDLEPVREAVTSALEARTPQA